MAKDITFKVSKAGCEALEVTWSAPESVDDPRWEEVVSNPATDINDAAVRNLVISIQSGARSRINPEAEDGGAEAVQSFVSAYKQGQRQAGGGGRSRKVTLSEDQQAMFTEEQLATLAAQGVQL